MDIVNLLLYSYTNKYMKKNAIIFDLDGTLWDTTFIYKRVYDRECKRLNKEIIYTLDSFKEFMGSSPKGVIDKMSKDLNWSKEECINFFTPAYLEVLKEINKCGAKLYPLELETLSVLSKEYDLYIVSNSNKGYVESYLNTSKCSEFFKGYLQAGDTSLDKGDNIVKLIKDNNISKAIYVGDTDIDYKACKKANIDIIYASYGFGNIKEYKYKLNKLSDLIDIKDRLFN